jgi:phosphocarrier protein FPr/phosphocarrier protein
MPGLMVLSPMTGWVSPLDEVPDPVFAERILGDGVAIDPTTSHLNAPCDGVIAVCAKHAVTIRTEIGAEILVHVGLETVALNGQGFTSLAREGQRVKAGDALLEFDLEYLGKYAKSLLSPVVIANGDKFRIARRSQNQLITIGDFLMEIEPLVATADAGAAPANLVSRSVVVAVEHGLHARPAALVANAAKRFAGDVTLSCRGKNANAKSAVTVMALGVGFHDEVTITAPTHEAVDILAALLETSAHQTAAALEPAPLPQTLPENTATHIHGVCAAPGRVLGRTVRLRSGDIPVPEEGHGIAPETAALQRALGEVKARLEQAASSDDRTKRDILSAHIALLEDAELFRVATGLIEQGKSAGYAWRQAVRSFAETFRAMRDARMRERAADLLDLERQVVSVLTGGTASAHTTLPSSAILIAEEILPSDLADASHVAGFVSAGGGATAHAAILAAGLNIPALVGAGRAVLEIPDGTDVLLNADAGVLDLRPDPGAAAAAREAAEHAAERQSRDLARACEDCVTVDGNRVEIFANLGKGAEEAAAAVRLGAEGCGVLRTEFLFMDRATPPDEEEQRAAYQGIADALGDRSFILRTFDIGADKPVPYLTFPPEDNPQLGLRGVRTALVWPELLRTQLKAAVRVKPCCKIMVPMITAASELAAVRAILDELCQEEGVAPIALGAMIETPSAAILADQLAHEADFLSIGTNDLTQYVLAIDRSHRQLSARLDALHPAVLRLIAHTAEAATAAGKTAAVCGGLAADLIAAPLLIGLGVTELSVPAPVIPRLKSLVRSLNEDDCLEAAQEALKLASAAEVRAFVKTRFAGEDRL